MWLILGGFALLGATGVYLASVTAFTWWLGTTQQTPFYMLMVFLHLALGFLLMLIAAVCGLLHLRRGRPEPSAAEEAQP